MVSCPSINWFSYFRELSGLRQYEFEEALAARCISLGEYMEIIEHAAMDACAWAMLRDADTYSAEDILPLASRLLAGYIRRKADLAARVTLTGEGSGPGRLADSRDRLAAIHRRVEGIKAGLEKP